jgi:hypothetical protein
MARLEAEHRALRGRLESRRGWRRVVAVLLVILTSLSVTTTAVAFWVHDTILDTDQFMETVGPVLEDPVFYELIGRRTSEEVLDVLDIETRVTTALSQLDAFLSEALLDALELGPQGRELLERFDRPSLTALAPSITEALETRVDMRIRSFFASEAFTTRLPDLVRRAHEVTVALARDELSELPNVYIADGEVRLNLIPLIAEAIQGVVDDIRGFLPDIDLPPVVSDQLAQGREQLAEALEARLPEDFGQVTVMSEDNLSALQTAAVRLDRLVWGLVILSAILVAATFAISPTRRRTAVHLGIGVAAALGLSLIAVGELERAVVDQFVDPGSQESARVLVARLLVALRNTMLVIGVISLLVAIVAYLAGRPSWLRRASDEVSGLTDPEAPASDLDIWVAAHNDGLRIVGLAIAIGAAVLLIGGRPIPLLVLGGVLALYLWAVAQATKRVEEVTNEGAQPTVSEKIGVPDE